MWDKNVAPVIGQRLSYDVGQTPKRSPCALNLQTSNNRPAGASPFASLS